MSERTATLNRVLLSFPTTLVNLATTKADANTPAQSWIQLAVVGDFVSNKYGKFSIEKTDLVEMVQNFAADRTPIDYDHLTNSPTHPHDSIAAGWLQRVELRDGGTTLWGLVEWTPDAEKRIENREYRFISPSFMKDYKTPTGEKVGTKLLAAALTNVPFLPEMAAVVLGADAVFGQFALSLPAGTAQATRAVSLAEIGQRVKFQPDADRTPELTDEDRRLTFIVKSSIGAGDAEFVRLTRLDGTEFGWFRAEAQLAPAPAVPERTTQEDTTMQDTKTTDSVEQKAAQFSARVAALSNGRTLRDAISLATVQDAEGAEAYRLAGIGAEPVNDAPAPISLSARTGESFDDMALRYANEKGVSLRVAVHEVGKARPDLAAARG